MSEAITEYTTKKMDKVSEDSGNDSGHNSMNTSQDARSRFLRRLRSDLTRSLLILKNELGAT